VRDRALGAQVLVVRMGMRHQSRIAEEVEGFLVGFHGSYQMRGLIEIEPGLVLEQMGRALPELVRLTAPLLAVQTSDPEALAMALVRPAVCHYLVPGHDDDRLLDQLRVAAGIP